jgi:hypothetical protein
MTWYVFTVNPCPFRGYIGKRDRIRSRQLRVVVVVVAEAREQTSKRSVSSSSTEEYMKSAYEDLTCDVKALYVL